MNKNVNLRQQRFLELYVESGNATDALIKAGYKPKYADRAAHIMIRRPHIKAELDKIRERLAKSAQLTCEYKLNVLQQGIEHYFKEKEYDKAAKLIEVANKMQGHIAPTQVESLTISSSIEDLRNAKAAYYKKEF